MFETIDIDRMRLIGKSERAGYEARAATGDLPAVRQEVTVRFLPLVRKIAMGYRRQYPQYASEIESAAAYGAWYYFKGLNEQLPVSIRCLKLQTNNCIRRAIRRERHSGLSAGYGADPPGRVTSIDAPFRGGEGHGAWQIDRRSPRQAAFGSDEVDRANSVMEAMGRIESRADEILSRRAAGWTLKEVGQHLGVSKQRVKQIEERLHSDFIQTYLTLKRHSQASRPEIRAVAVRLTVSKLTRSRLELSGNSGSLVAAFRSKVMSALENGEETGNGRGIVINLRVDGADDPLHMMFPADGRAGFAKVTAHPFEGLRIRRWSIAGGDFIGSAPTEHRLHLIEPCDSELARLWRARWAGLRHGALGPS